MHNFEWALAQMKTGSNVKRLQFRDTCYLRIQFPDSSSLNNLPYIQMVKKTKAGVAIFPCPLSCESLLAEDWLLADENTF